MAYTNNYQKFKKYIREKIYQWMESDESIDLNRKILLNNSKRTSQKPHKRIKPNKSTNNKGRKHE